MRKEIKVLLFVLFIVLSCESISYLVLTFLKVKYGLTYYPVISLSENQRIMLKRLLNGESKYIVYDPTLGWAIKANAEEQAKCNLATYKSNSSGIRGDKDYELSPPLDVFRIAAFGDSFTHCNDVNNNETWEAIMESLNNNLEVMNFGVPGYGLDQAYLRYLKNGVKYKPDIVFIDFMTNDIYRHPNNFRPFVSYSGLPLSKPRYLIKNDRLILLPNPIPKLEDYRMLLENTADFLKKLGVHDYYYSSRYKSSLLNISHTIRLFKLFFSKIQSYDGYYNQKSEAYYLTVKIIDTFFSKVIKNNSIPIILIFPSHHDIQRYKHDKTKIYSPLLKYLDLKGYRYIDLMDAFSRIEENKGRNGHCTHYNPTENTMVAKYVFNYLLKHKLIELSNTQSSHYIAPH